MSLWRLEWLRLVRTRRLVALVAVFAFFGAVAAPMTRYLAELLRSTAGDIQIIAPPPTPADAVANYVGNAAQIGLLVFALVAASALAVDAHRETAVFLRTSVRRPADLVLPRFVVTTLAGMASFTVGTLACWWGTAALLGPLPVGGMLLGVALGGAYLAFLAALTAVFASRLRSVVGVAAAVLGTALVLAIVGGLGEIGGWLPSALVGALSSLAAGGEPADLLRALLVTVTSTGLLLVAAVRLAGTREI
jgi:ABC-2 type transport system permease protein